MKEAPRYQTPIIETHCHLDYLKMGCGETLEEAHQAGVEKIITISVEPKNQNTALQIAREWSQVYATQGIHPHEAKDYSPEIDALMRQNALDPKVVAIGEIGLDYHYNHSPKDIQRQVFERQLQLAVDLKLPVVFHTREAEDDTLAILKNFEGKLSQLGVFHCYSSNLELAEYVLSRGFKLGFNGVITFKAAENVREIFKLTPLTQVLLETDAPFLTPLPYRGQENAPKYLPWVVQKMCELKQMDGEELLKTIYQNSFDLFPKLNN